MSQEPKPSPSPPAAKQAETLEDAVYKPNLSDDNKALRGTDPLIAIPTALITYCCVAALIFFVATQTEVGKQAIKKTVGIDISDDASKDKEEEPPPPPPAPAAPAAPPVKIEIKDAPPPPPVTGQEVVPDVAPKEIPKIDYSQSFAAKPGETYVGAIGGIGGAGGSGLGNIGGAGASSATIHDFTHEQVVVTYQPPAPPYPPMAKAAKIQGTVLLEIVIGLDGSPQSVHVLEGHQMLRAHATDYAKKWKFKPATMDGHPVLAKFNLRLPYTLK